MQRSRPNKLNIRNVAKPLKYKKRKQQGRIPYSAMAKQVTSDMARIYKMFNTEQKYQDYTGATVQGTTLTLALINGLSQGTTSTTRLGDTIRTTSIELNLRCAIATTSTTGYVLFRFIIIRDLQPNGANFTAGQLLNTPTNVLSPLTMSTCKRFVWIDDQIITLDLNGPEAYTHRRVYNIDFHPEYGLGNAGTIADISKEALYLCFLSDDNVNQPSYSYWARLHFIDN